MMEQHRNTWKYGLDDLTTTPSNHLCTNVTILGFVSIMNPYIIIIIHVFSNIDYRSL